MLNTWAMCALEGDPNLSTFGTLYRRHTHHRCLHSDCKLSNRGLHPCAKLVAKMVSSVAQHPLDPLSAAEIKAAAACVRAFKQTPETVRFNSISLQVKDLSLLPTVCHVPDAMRNKLQIGRSAECSAANIAVDHRRADNIATRQR